MDTCPVVSYVEYVTALLPRILVALVLEFVVVVMQHIFSLTLLKKVASMVVVVPWAAWFVCFKKMQKPRNKRVLEENGLVKRYSSRPQRAHSYENDALDYANGLQQISRFEILTNLEREQKLVQIEKITQRRLAPPAIYHEKVNHSSQSLARTEKQSKNKQLNDLKLKGSSLLFFPLSSNIFAGKEKIIKT